MGAVEDEVFVHLVRDDESVVMLCQPDDLGPHVRGEDGAGRIVRIVHQNDPRAVGHGGRKEVEVGLEVGPVAAAR
jgi:hypothetical protein